MGFKVQSEVGIRIRVRLENQGENFDDGVYL